MATTHDKSLIVHGQGVFVFKQPTLTTPCVFHIWDKTKTTGIRVQFTSICVHVKLVPAGTFLCDPHNARGLSDISGAYYWFSLDAQNQRLYAGVGEARIETADYKYELGHTYKSFLEAMTQIEFLTAHIKPLRLLRDPVLSSSVALVVRNTDDLTMEDISRGTYMPKANLSIVAQKLYDCIAGPKFALNTPDFPQFSAAIEHSIATPGLWCNRRLAEKATEFSKDKPAPLETYLRITLSENNGESPGIPYVMEIWPRGGHYSPIHNHGAANAVIRVLHGAINVSLFPYLGASISFAAREFVEGEITWISPTMNQVHRLKNIRDDQTCITIQCYMYDESDRTHHDFFDFIDDVGSVGYYEPDSDMDFIAFKELMRREWLEAQAMRRCACFPK